VNGVQGFVTDLREVLRGRDFRRLFATRLTSQSGDGAFQVGLAGLFFFSPERAANAAGIAAAFAVAVLPYTALGPFVGVLLDRWRRRQVLLVGNAVRSMLTLGIAALVLAHVVGPVLYIAVLACLSVNRFLLAGLGASLPHVVAERELVMANAVTPTSGTLAAMAGALLGYGVRLAVGPGGTGDAAVVALAALGYAAASALATRMHPGLLGPDPAAVPAPATRTAEPTATPPPADAEPAASPDGSKTADAEPPAASPDGSKTAAAEPPAAAPAPAAAGSAVTATGVVRVLIDLRAGLGHLRRRPVPATALAAIGVHRFAFGAVTVMTVLMCRYRLAPAGEPERGFALLATTVGLIGAGYAAAALLTPTGTAWLGPRGWIAGCLAVAGLIPAALAVAASTPVLLAASFLFGLAGQGVKICVDALVQTGVDDDFRGRAFSVYDLVFNAAFMSAVVGSALVLPADGYSRPWLAALAVLYVSAAAAYHRTNRRWTAPTVVVAR
jgi:MFS family permease